MSNHSPEDDNTVPTQFRLVTTYESASKDAADENQRRIEGVELEHNPIASLPAFKHFGDGHAERRSGPVNQQRAELVGAYFTGIG